MRSNLGIEASKPADESNENSSKAACACDVYTAAATVFFFKRASLCGQYSLPDQQQAAYSCRRPPQ
jgi:hypothetical protein